MSDTPHRDIAFRAGCPWYTCEVPNCQPECENYKISALEILRAALPWDLPPERLEAKARALMRKWLAADCRTQEYLDKYWENYTAPALAAYRSDLIMRELYPEKFK